MKVNLLLMLGICLILGCSTISDLANEAVIRDSDGRLRLSPRIDTIVENVETIGSVTGIPGANYISELYVVISGIALAMLESKRRKEKLKNQG